MKRINPDKGMNCFLAMAMAIILVVPSGCSDHAVSSSPYLVLYAFDEEGQLLAMNMSVQETDSILGRPIHIGELSGKDIVLAESGVGMTNMAMTLQRLIDIYHPRGVVFSGIAGAIDNSVHIGDIVVCKTWRAHDHGFYQAEGFRPTNIITFDGSAGHIVGTSTFVVDSAYLALAARLDKQQFSFARIGDREPDLFVGGIGVSGSSFINNYEKRIWLQEEFGALITDMESAALAQVCVANDIPFIVFRSSSDLAGGSVSESAEAEMDQFFSIAADNSSKVVMRFLAEL
jgi:adenosylhomocysteine nucleosidase